MLTPVKELNTKLVELAASHSDVTFVHQKHIDMTMLTDAKHLHSSKVPIYAKNIINGLLKAYGIREKSELFTLGNEKRSSVDNINRPHYNTNETSDIRNRMMRIANYKIPEAETAPSQFSNPEASVRFRERNQPTTNDAIIRNAVSQFTNIIMNYIQR